VKDDDHPYLAYSPKISIENSSEPFRAYLGAILSGVKDVSVKSSNTIGPDMLIDGMAKADEYSLPKNGIGNDSAAHRGSSNDETAANSSTTYDPAGQEKTVSELMVCPFLI
jgi:hypothetical protein